MIKKIIFTLIFSLFLNNSFAQTNEENEIKDEKKYGVKLNKIDSSRFFNTALIQVLDKTTAKSYDLKIKVGESLDFGNIIIKVNKCWQAPLDQKPDSRILMEIYEKISIDNQETSNESKDNEEESPNKQIFHGWMISSSPSVSALEHPVYDVTALNCKE